MTSESASRARRLGVESALIVLSVLLGFAVSEWRDRVRDRDLARSAVVNFRREIAGNLARLKEAQPKHAAMAERLGTVAEMPNATGTAFDAFRASMPAGGLDTKPLRDVAWETAESTGALRLLDYDTAALLSETYLVQHSTIQPTLQLLTERFLSPANFDPAQRVAMLRTHHMVIDQLNGQETYLMDVYREALKKLPTP